MRETDTQFQVGRQYLNRIYFLRNKIIRIWLFVNWNVYYPPKNYVTEIIYFNLDGAKIEENGFAALNFSDKMITTL